MEKYGFVYLWRDRKHNKFYIGSHWGFENDGYLCSSRWMRAAFKRRPQDFKRRIIETTSNRGDLNNLEHKWLQMIREDEIGKKYYNLKNHRFGHWSEDECKRLSVGEKISQSHKNHPGGWGHWKTGSKHSEETLRKLSESHKGKTWNLVHGQEKADELREKHINWLKTRSYTHSEETRKKISDAKAGKVPWNKGIKQSEYRKQSK